MNFSDSILLAIPGAVISLLGLYLQSRREKNIPRVNESEAMLHDAETDKLRDEITRSVLATAQQEINKYTGRITDLESLVERQNQRIANLLEQNATLTHELQLRDRVILELRNEIERFGRRVTELQERLAKYEATA